MHAGPCGVSYDVVVGVVVIGERSCVVDVGGCSCVVDVGGCSCVVDVGGCSCVVDVGGCSCVVDVGGRSCVVDVGGCSCVVDVRGCTCSCVVDVGGRSCVVVLGWSALNSSQINLSEKPSNAWSGISSHRTRSSWVSISSHDRYPPNSSLLNSSSFIGSLSIPIIASTFNNARLPSARSVGQRNVAAGFARLLTREITVIDHVPTKSCTAVS